MKEIGEKLSFLHADKDQCLLHVHSISFGWCGWLCLGMPKVHRITNLQFLRGILLDFHDFLDPNGPPREF